MKKYIFLFLFIILICPSVYASEFNLNSYTSATKDGTKNRYKATEIYNTGISSTFVFGTRYSGRISDIDTYFEYPFVANTTYRLTYNMNTEDFRNNFAGGYWWDCDDETQSNPYRSNVSYINYKKIQITFKPTENTTCIRMWVKSTNLASTAITGVSNWRLDSITIYDPDWQSGSGSGQGTSPAPTPSPNSNQDIINNQNNNTEDIINNANQNTEDIISSIQESTDKVGETIQNAFENKCPNIFNFPYTSNNVYSLVANRDDFFKVTDFSVHLESGVTYYFSYGSNKNYGAQSGTDTVQLGLLLDGGYSYYIFPSNKSGNFTVSTTGDYTIRLDCNKELSTCTYYNFYIGTVNRPWCEFGTSIGNKIDDNTAAIDNLNDTITDDNIDDNTGFFSGFSNNMHGLSSIITIPLTTIQSLANTSCVALTLPIPFTNDSIDLPCMSQLYDTYAHDIYSLWQIVSFGIISYYICLDIFKMVKGFKDPNEDKIEVLDL